MLMFAIIAVFIAGPDGRAHPGVPGQEDRTQGDHDGGAGAADPARFDPGLFRGGQRDPAGVSAILNPGPHGLSEILYLYTSSNGNNGSAFAGIGANTPYLQLDGGLRHADWPLRLPDTDHGLWRLAGQEAGRARRIGHVPHHYAALRGSA